MRLSAAGGALAWHRRKPIAALGQGPERDRVSGALRAPRRPAGKALFEMRWREGLACLACGHCGFCALKTRKLFQCNRCKKQVRLTAGTVFQRRPSCRSTAWFVAIYHLAQGKNGISSIELGRRLGVKRQTAWLDQARADAGDGRARGRKAEARGPGRGRRRLSRRRERPGRQARPRCRGQDADRRRGRDHGSSAGRGGCG